MSRQVTLPVEEVTQDYAYELHTNIPDGTLEQPLPPFRSFPARNRVSPTGSGRSAPQNRNWDSDLGSSSDAAYDTPHRLQTSGGSVAHSHRQGIEESTLTLDRHASTLPEFTPFPAAAPSSRYAPPPSSRAEPTRPVLPPLIYPEGAGSGPWASERTINLVGESSTPVIRYPR
ncbi:C2H2 zinc finger [Rhizoctonia solani]|uniref:C2H2 zinc finger n=1 Tax=Rhizoctonia solani TaxID=456999 RepID=A0A8H7M692_9AGAM